ncbi:unnamed protein product [marine sediment metagenome]|uniref:Uncharacterized protein n=1 Tax=marine sediment metagenome TaxID=412755 RepID=X1A7K1_9ZZZZ
MHKHKFHFVRIWMEMHGGQRIAEFICDCGLIKRVDVNDEDEE